MERYPIPVSAVVSTPPPPALATKNSQLSAISNSLIAAPTNTFQLTKITGAAGNYSANFQVNFDQTKLVRPLLPASTQITLQTSGVGAIKTITGCGGVSSGFSSCVTVGTGSMGFKAIATCPATYTMVGGGCSPANGVLADSLPSGDYAWLCTVGSGTVVAGVRCCK